MNNDLTEEKILEYLEEYLEILDTNFSIYNTKKKLGTDKVLEILKDTKSLLEEYFVRNQILASKYAIKKFIPIVDRALKVEKNLEKYDMLRAYLKVGYRIGARTSLEHYMIYREWDEKNEDKFYAPRYEAIRGYIYYLEQVTKNPNFKMLIVNMMSGGGKTYPEKISEAWNFGCDPTGTVLSLCSNDDVVKGGSRVVIDEIKSEPFGEVFPDMRFSEEDKHFFLKETDSVWKLRQCKLNASYFAKTTNSNVVGVRASQRIHIDDLYPSYVEAMDKNLNIKYLNTFFTVWRKRFVQNITAKVVVTGTLWASGDFISLLLHTIKRDNRFHKHPIFKYTYVNEDESVVVIQIPALDYETGLSTMPALKTTKELLEEKSNIEEYLWETNFQQRPVDPESLYFSYNRLRLYTKLPKTEYEGCYAVIDATRKTGKDFFAMPIFMKISSDESPDFYLKDCLFTRTATKDMYDDICNKIIEHHIVELVIESNVTSELKQNIDNILKENGVFYCQIREKYNTVNKQTRITDQKGNIIKKLVFPDKNLNGVNTDIGRFMENLTLYNDGGKNYNDDACDSSALFTSEFVEQKSRSPKVKAIKRLF